MSLNLDGLYSSTRDFAILDTQPAGVAAILAAFNGDYAGRRLTASTGTGDLVWSLGAAPAGLRMIDSARRSIDPEDEEMAYVPATSALCDAAKHASHPAYTAGHRLRHGGSDNDYRCAAAPDSTPPHYRDYRALTGLVVICTAVEVGLT